MTDHFNRLTPAQAERLSLLAEECAEVIQAIMKIQRHGYGSRHPDRSHMNNRLDLEKEISHVQIAIGLLEFAEDINPITIAKWRRMKWASIGKYLHHQSEFEHWQRAFAVELDSLAQEARTPKGRTGKQE